MELDLFIRLLLLVSTLVGSIDNFQVHQLLDAYKRFQELLTGAILVVICLPFTLVKIYEELVEFPTFPANIRIYRDTAVVVILSYVLLLDINLSYIWLAIFPVIAIAFIYALFIELCCPGDSGSSSTTGGTESNDEKTTKVPGEVQLIVMMPFGALLVMAQLDDHVADRFALSQFLLFLSSTLGALTLMMMRLPAGASPGIAPASELLRKTFLVLLLVTAHTVVAESLGEDVVLMCMPEVVPVLLWFSFHLDRGSSIISIDKMKPHRNGLIVLGAVVVAPVFAYLATSMDESGLSWCTAFLVSCSVSGLLTYYVVFMLRQWPGQQAGKDVASDICRPIYIQSKKQAGNGKATVSLEEAVQSKKQAGSLEEAVQLLMYWAKILLVAAAALLLLKYLVAVRLDLQEPLVDTLCQNIRRLCR